jgi:hypothetical protein
MHYIMNGLQALPCCQREEQKMVGSNPTRV